MPQLMNMSLDLPLRFTTMSDFPASAVLFPSPSRCAPCASPSVPSSGDRAPAGIPKPSLSRLNNNNNNNDNNNNKNNTDNNNNTKVGQI
jgi:hypothetical protein